MTWHPMEISGFSPQLLDDPDFCDHLRKSLGESLVLVFRDMPEFDVAAQVRLTNVFGDVFESLDRDVAHPDEPSVQLLARDGTPGDDRDNGYYWHSDRSYLPDAAKATMLHAQLVSAVGGDTEFANMHRVYEIAKQRRIAFENLTANHSYVKYHRTLEPQHFSSAVADIWQDKYPDTKQPLVKLNPFSQTPALYLSQLCITEIVGLSESDSEQMLGELYEIALAEDNIYRHSWRAGDLVVWGNVGLMHRATRSQGRRSMHRTIAK